MKEKIYNLNRPVNFYIPFKKMDEERGIVYGYATTPMLDYDKQRIDMAAFAKALPEYLEYGNIREMHQTRRGVGKVLNETVKMDDSGCFLGAKIIPQDVRELCEAGVYSGFSVGLSDCLLKTDDSAPSGIITGDDMKIIEISLVDRPANPQARISAYKMVGGKVETILEKLEKEEVKPEPPVKKFVSFADGWAAAQLANDLPAMTDFLYSVMSNIIWSPDGTMEEKKSALVAAVNEFADMAASYMTGEKLAESKPGILAALLGAVGCADKLTVEDLKKLSKEDAWKKFFVTEVKSEPEPSKTLDVVEIIKAVLAEFAKEFAEAKTQLGDLRGELAKKDEANKALEERVKKIEETPAPPKAKANTDIIPAGGGEQKTFEELVAIKNKLAMSGDPEARRAADLMGTLLFQSQYGGK